MLNTIKSLAHVDKHEACVSLRKSEKLSRFRESFSFRRKVEAEAQIHSLQLIFGHEKKSLDMSG